MEWYGFSWLRLTNIVFQDRSRFFMNGALPERATPAGYAALIDAYGLPVPFPRTLSAIAERPHDSGARTDGGMLTPRHAPPQRSKAI